MSGIVRGSIVRMWLFRSSSSERYYQTLLYSDGATSCDCPGWTKRVVAGVRMCKHTRLVDAGQADALATKVVDYNDAYKDYCPILPPASVNGRTTDADVEPTTRTFDLE